MATVHEEPEEWQDSLPPSRPYRSRTLADAPRERVACGS